jgi:hypothetical protein
MCLDCGEHIAPNKAQHSEWRGTETLTLCRDVRYQDGDTLSVSSVKGKPRETICILLGFKRKATHADKLAEVLRGLDHVNYALELNLKALGLMQRERDELMSAHRNVALAAKAALAAYEKDRA